MTDQSESPSMPLNHSHGCAFKTHGGMCTCGLDTRVQLQTTAYNDLTDRGRAFSRGLDYDRWIDQIHDHVEVNDD